VREGASAQMLMYVCMYGCMYVYIYSSIHTISCVHAYEHVSGTVHACLRKCMHLSKTCTLLSHFPQYLGTHYGTGGKGHLLTNVLLSHAIS